jgi:MFS superfamily sulfate permease-like transporter
MKIELGKYASMFLTVIAVLVFFGIALSQEWFPKDWMSAGILAIIVIAVVWMIPKHGHEGK